LELESLGRLISALDRRGYRVIGPVLREGAIVYDVVERPEDLPRGFTADQSPGSYRLRDRHDETLFAYAAGPQSLKKFLHPAELRLFEAQRDAGAFKILDNGAPPGPYAFLGVRGCDLAALALEDRVLTGGQYTDRDYQRRRNGAFLVAVNCTEPAATCFCASMGAGPKAAGGFDLALTEIADPHRFVAEVGSLRGREILKELECRPAAPEDCSAAQAAIESATARMGRHIDTAGLPELLYDNFEHPRWDQVAARCLCCANCTNSCPTCFCTTLEDSTGIAGGRAERWRRWDSCFTLSHSYIHGGSIRSSAKSRYRQWLTHKLAFWVDQFGSFGCVGCGRCITWCPVGIDITEEVAALRGSDSSPAANGGPSDGR
jgi:ferredoxin